jgi:hypothetical protein
MKLIRRIAALAILMACLGSFGNNAHAEWGACHDQALATYDVCQLNCQRAQYPNDRYYSETVCSYECYSKYYYALYACDNP